MTLAQWAKLQSLDITHWRNNDRGDLETTNLEEATLITIPDTTSLIDRKSAYRLDDYVVSSCSGGSLWFIRRHMLEK